MIVYSHILHDVDRRNPPQEKLCTSHQISHLGITQTKGDLSPEAGDAGKSNLIIFTANSAAAQ
jgi:hypothetical protein